MEKHQELIEIIKKLPYIQPPDDFTPGVMKSVMNARPGFLNRTWNFLFRPREFGVNHTSVLQGTAERNEIYIYFILVAVAHLTFAVILFFGLQDVYDKTIMPSLVFWQPWMTLFIAGWLFIWGFLLRKGAEKRIRKARAAALFYIEVVIINATLLFMVFNHVIFLIPIIALTAFIRIAAGIFLVLICGSKSMKINNSYIDVA